MGWGLHPRSIHGELARFVVVLAVPLVAVIAYVLHDRAEHDIADAENVVRRLADNGAERAARFAEEARITLEAIARRPLVRAMDPARCDPGLRHLLDLYPRASNFLVVDREGRILCGAIPPPRDRVVRIQDEALLRELLASGRFALSQPVVGRINRRWTVAAVQPVFGEDGAVNGSLSMSIDLVHWRPFPPVTGEPEDTIVTLLSGDRVVARSSDAEKWVGRDVSAGEIMRHVREKKQGVVRARGVADLERIWAFRPVPGTGWTVLAGIRAEHVMGPVQSRTVNVVLVVALVVGVVIALAVGFARRLARPVDRMAAALRRRAEGQAGVTIPVSGPREIAAVAEELNRGIEERERAERALAGLARDLEDRVRLRTAELEAANQELEAFSYSVSHDLRAPLRHIDGFANLLQKELGAPGGKAGHYLATIAAAAKRMGLLIDDLLQFSRTGRLPLALRRVEPGPMVQALIHEAAPEIGQRRVEWVVGELPAVMADPALLRIVLQNLLSNALKYTRPRPLARIEVQAARLGAGAVELSVRDNGVGFDMQFADKLFGVFQRLHRDEEFEGTGIGLATARRIVHRHGQRIRGEGAPGEGATFTFTMAVAEVVHEGSGEAPG